MNIPSRVNPFGYDNSIPPGYTGVDCLYKTGSTNFIEVGTFLCSGFEVDIKNDNFGVTRFIGGSCQSLVSGYGIRPFYLRGNNPEWLAFCQGGGYGYNVNNFSTFKRFTCKLTRSEVLLDDVEQTSFTAYTDTEPYTAAQPVFIGKVADSSAGRAYYYTVKIWDDTENLRHSFIPVLDAAGTPCMFDLVSKQPFYNSGTGQFIAGFTMDQALNLANLPAPTTLNTLTISLPLEAKLVLYNTGVEAALTKAAEKGWNIAVQYRDTFDDESIRDKYAHCTNVNDMLAVNPDYKNDLTEDGEWIYPLTNMTEFPTSTPFFFEGSPMRKIDIELPKVVNGDFILASVDKLEEARVIMPAAVRINRLFQGTPVKTFYVEAPLATNNGFAFANCPNVEEITEENFNTGKQHSGNFFAWQSPKVRRIALDFTEATWITYLSSSPVLSSFESTLPKAYVAIGAFYKTILDRPSALRILTSLPPYTGDSEPARPNGQYMLDIGIHVDHKNDEEILAAIASLEANWWRLTVQWTGTPTTQTASTFGLRKPPIYAKLSTMELPDGTSEDYLAWGHYVTNWEENGYQEFASLEEAHAHFNLEMETEE